LTDGPSAILAFQQCSWPDLPRLAVCGKCAFLSPKRNLQCFFAMNFSWPGISDRGLADQKSIAWGLASVLNIPVFNHSDDVSFIRLAELANRSHGVHPFAICDS